jgi:hypothetical protein
VPLELDYVDESQYCNDEAEWTKEPHEQAPPTHKNHNNKAMEKDRQIYPYYHFIIRIGQFQYRMHKMRIGMLLKIRYDREARCMWLIGIGRDALGHFCCNWFALLFSTTKVRTTSMLSIYSTFRICQQSMSGIEVLLL